MMHLNYGPVGRHYSGYATKRRKVIYFHLVLNGAVLEEIAVVTVGKRTYFTHNPAKDQWDYEVWSTGDKLSIVEAAQKAYGREK